MITRRCFALAAASALASGIAAKRANALAWPTHPVRIIVPFAAGGPTDVIARIVGERLSKSWDQQVLIENRPGGGTNVGDEFVAHSGARRPYGVDGWLVAGRYPRPLSLAQL